jgi:spermidine synthase
MIFTPSLHPLLIHLTVFWGGFFVMAIELLSSKILAPYFGSSIFVWGAIITVFMISLSLGYLKGGHLSLHHPSLQRLGSILIASGILAIPIISLNTEILTWMVSNISEPRHGSLIATIVLFGGTTATAGMISPYSIRLMASETASSGKSAGNLYFLSTLGSAIGTLLTSFYFVLWFEIESIIKGLIIISILMGSFVFFIGRDQSTPFKNKLHTVCIPLLSFFIFHHILSENQRKTTVIHTEKSVYRNIVVWEKNMTRCLTFKDTMGRQSCINLENHQHVIAHYIQHMLGTLFINPSPKRVLIIGLGGGTLPNALRTLYPQLLIDAVEIDPAIIRIAKKYFYFEEDKLLHAIESDGRHYIRNAQKQNIHYDIIFLDAFDNNYIPEHMLTKEFLLELKSTLTPKGLVAANTFARSRMYHHEAATYQSVFGKYYNIMEEGGGNRVIIASVDELPSIDALSKNASLFSTSFNSIGIHSSVKLLESFKIGPLEKEAYFFTDQHSPSNILNTP